MPTDDVLVLDNSEPFEDLEKFVRFVLEWCVCCFLVAALDNHDSARPQRLTDAIDGALLDRVDDCDQVPLLSSEVELFVRCQLGLNFQVRGRGGLSGLFQP